MNKDDFAETIPGESTMIHLSKVWMLQLVVQVNLLVVLHIPERLHERWEPSVEEAGIDLPRDLRFGVLPRETREP